MWVRTSKGQLRDMPGICEREAYIALLSRAARASDEFSLFAKETRRSRTNVV